MGKPFQKLQKPESYKPTNYQKKVIRFCVGRGAAGVFLSPGLGKTSVMLSVFSSLQKANVAETMLIIAPLIICDTVWPKEIRKWKQFNHLTHTVLHGKDKEKLLYEDHDIYIINPEGLEWLCNKIKEDKFLKNKFDVLTIDESTKFKNSGSKRFKILKTILGNFSRRYILTGTPIANNLMNIFSQAYILDLGRSLGPYITHFRNKYFYSTGYGGYTYLPMDGAEEEIYKQLKDLIIRMDSKDYLDLPPCVFVNKTFDLDEKTAKIYEEVEKDLISELSGDTVVALSKSVAVQKCRQIANGGIYLENFDNPNKRKTKQIHYKKAEICESIVEELDGMPCLIVYEFHHDLERLVEKFGKKARVISSKSTRQDKIKFEDDWNKGKIHVGIAQMTIVSHGLNLQGVQGALIEHSLTYDYEVDDQIIQRIYRNGQKHKTFVYRIIANNTVDEDMVATIERKEKNQNKFLELFKQRKGIK